MKVVITDTICYGSRVRVVGGDESIFQRITDRNNPRGLTARSFPTGDGDYVTAAIINASSPKTVVGFGADATLFQRVKKLFVKGQLVPGELNQKVNKLELQVEEPAFWLWGDGTRSLVAYVAAYGTTAGVELGDGRRGVEIGKVSAGQPSAQRLEVDTKSLKAAAAPLIEGGADAKQLSVQVRAVE